MFRPAAALLLSAALALPAVPAQAELDRRQAAQVLGGLAALFVLKEALDRRDDKRKTREAPVRREHAHRDRVHRPDLHRPGIHRPHRPAHRFGPDRWPHRDARVAPARCERVFQGARGPRVGYGARCMWRNVDRPRLLPNACLRDVQTRRGPRQVYPRRCLDRAGWRTSARR